MSVTSVLGWRDLDSKETHPRKIAITTNEATFVAKGHVNVTMAASRVAGIRTLRGPGKKDEYTRR